MIYPDAFRVALPRRVRAPARESARKIKDRGRPTKSSAGGWTEAQKRAYVLADNQLAITGSGWETISQAVHARTSYLAHVG